MAKKKLVYPYEGYSSSGSDADYEQPTETTKERFLDTPIKLGAFKDGVADGLLEGHRSDYHPDMYSYKQGYDFGLTMYNRLKESE